MEKTSHPKIKSYLSPFNKYGVRSLSTSESHPKLCTTTEPKKIQFHRQNRQKTELLKPNLQIRLQDFRKKQNKQNKLLKFTMNRYKCKDPNKNSYLEINQTNHQQQYQQASDILILVRQLKQKLVSLERDNRKLRELQEADQIKLLKQEQIIRNLEQALDLTRGHASYSLRPIYTSNKTSLNFGKLFKAEKDNSLQGAQKSLEQKIFELESQNKKLHEFYANLQQEHKMLSTKYQKTQNAQKQTCKICRQNNFQAMGLLLTQIQTNKNKQLQQINALLSDVSSHYF